ncbi:MAG: DUF2924 domain-containing protein [Sphingobium sp.]
MKRMRANTKIARDVAALTDMSLRELRMEWERRYGAAPRHRSVDLLRRVLAWRMQADVLGGLDAATRRMLGREGEVQLGTTPGMRLAREWAGRVHEVVVVESGVVYEGCSYKSLSAVARHITGMRWNGPRFFGLRQENIR